MLVVSINNLIMKTFIVSIGHLDDNNTEYINTEVSINDKNVDDFGVNPEKYINGYDFENTYFVSEINYK